MNAEILETIKAKMLGLDIQIFGLSAHLKIEAVHYMVLPCFSIFLQPYHLTPRTFPKSSRILLKLPPPTSILCLLAIPVVDALTKIPSSRANYYNSRADLPVSIIQIC